MEVSQLTLSLGYDGSLLASQQARQHHSTAVELSVRLVSDASLQTPKAYSNVSMYNNSVKAHLKDYQMPMQC